MERVYISGQITGLPLELAMLLFENAEVLLLDMGFVPVNPFKVDKPDNVEAWEDHMRHDIKALCDCSKILMLDNWHRSRGAELEMYIASQIGLEIMFAENLLQKTSTVGCWARKS